MDFVVLSTMVFPPYLKEWKISFNGEHDCAKKKLDVNSYKSSIDATTSTCFYIAIEVDNFENPCWCHNYSIHGDEQDLNKLNCDLIDVFVTKEGITAGNPDCTIAGRIMSDNMNYDYSKCQ